MHNNGVQPSPLVRCIMLALLQHGKVIVVIDSCPFSTSSIVSLYQTGAKTFLLLFNIIFSYGVLLHCVTLGIVVKMSAMIDQPIGVPLLKTCIFLV